MFHKILLSTVAVAALSGSAYAADLPTMKGPALYAPPAFSWTGAYVGGQIGYEWGAESTSLSTAAGGFGGTVPSLSTSGVIGGAHIGYNLQYSQFVFGLEGDINGSSYAGSGMNSLGTVGAYGSIPIDGSLRARLGYAWQRALIYATGGAAFGDIHQTSTLFATGATDTSDTLSVGWTVGGGIEYAIDTNWSARIEYRYTDYGNTAAYLGTSTAGFAGGPYTAQMHDTDNRVQAGFSYKFDMLQAPVLAKY